MYGLQHTTVATTTATPSLSSSWPVATRIKHRKKIFNQLYAAANNNNNNKTADHDDDHHHHQPVFDVDKVYTFEFYQHLLHFNDADDLKVDVGLGNLRIGLSQPLNGQALQFMATAVHANAVHQQPEGGAVEQALWSFDIWHASLYPRAAEVAAAAVQDAATAGSTR
jgi:hypothetical protein